MKPVKMYKDGGVQITMWPANNGGYTYQISKRYKDKNTEEWKDSKYLYKSDLEKLVVLLQEAINSESERVNYDAERVTSGQPATTPPGKFKYELAEEDVDDIPF